MPDRPLIAVVVPAYNLARYLGETLESVLAQTVPPGTLEIVVIDDGSTDPTPEVAADFAPRVRYVRQENRGLPAARNRGVSETTAPYLTFLDADDRLLPEKLGAELELLETRPDVDVAYSGWHYIDESGARLPQRGWSRHAGDVLPRLLLGNIIHPHAATLRRRCVEAAGGFDESLTSVEDWDLWIRISLNGATWAVVDHAALEYRVRGDGMHANATRMLENRIRVLDKAFERIRIVRPELAALRAAAYANAYVEAACDWARDEQMDNAITAMRRAVALAPSIVTDPRAIREVARLLLPLGRRNDDAVTARWTDIAPTVRRLVVAAVPRDGFGGRLRAELGLGRVSLRYLRKRARGAIAGMVS